MRTIYGVGINDADYPVTQYEGIKGNKRQTWKCPYYKKWHSMFNRCYDQKELDKHPSYIGCEVAKEWLYFTNFKKWIDQQNIAEWELRQLDKDFISEGTKVYSPKTCILLPQEINKFLTLRENCRGDYALGTRMEKSGKYSASCNDGSGNNVYLGRHDTELDAHLEWVKYKIKLLDGFVIKYKNEERLVYGLEMQLSKFNNCVNNKIFLE